MGENADVFIDEFLEACRNEDIEKVKRILQDTHPVIDLNYYDDKFKPGILEACCGNNIDLVSLLLKDSRISLMHETGKLKQEHILNTLFSKIRINLDIVRLILMSNRYTLMDIDKKWHKNTLYHLLTNGRDVLSMAIEHANIIDSLNRCVEEYYFRISSLHLASILNQPEKVKEFLENTENPNSTDDDGLTPFMYACIQGYDDIVDIFLEDTRVEVQIKDNNGMSPLMYASRFGHVYIVTRLLQYDIVLAHIHDTSLYFYKFQGDAITLATLFGHKQTIECILNHPQFTMGENTLMSQLAVITNAIHSKKVEIVSMVLDSGKIDLETLMAKNFYSPCSSAAAIENNVEVLDLLISRNIDKLSKNEYFHPLPAAAKEGNISNIRFLLSVPRINPTLGSIGYDAATELNRNNSPIFLAIYNGKIEAAKEMIQNATIRNEFEDTINGNSFLRACYLNDIDSLKSILKDKECDVNVKDKNGYRALSVAVKLKDLTCLRLLLNHPKINVNAVANAHGSTALHIATFDSSIRIVETLLSHPQINPNIFNRFHETPLHSAKYSPHILTLILNHPNFDKSKIFDSSIYMNGGFVEDMIEVDCPDVCIVEVLSHPIYSNYSLRGAFHVACSYGNRILKRFLDDERLELDIELCRNCVENDNEKKDYSKEIKLGFIFCKRLQVFPEEFTNNTEIIDGVKQLLNSNKSKSARK